MMSRKLTGNEEKNGMKRAYVAPMMEVLPFVLEQGFAVSTSSIQGTTMSLAPGDDIVPEGYFDEGKNWANDVWK